MWPGGPIALSNPPLEVLSLSGTNGTALMEVAPEEDGEGYDVTYHLPMFVVGRAARGD